MLEVVLSMGMSHGMTADIRRAELWNEGRSKAERSEGDSDVALLPEWQLSVASEPD